MSVSIGRTNCDSGLRLPPFPPSPSTWPSAMVGVGLRARAARAALPLYAARLVQLLLLMLRLASDLSMGDGRFFGKT